MENEVLDCEVVIESDARPKYTKESLDKALDEISRGVPILTTSKKYNIPNSTLVSRIKAQGTLQTSKGRQPLISAKDESIIVQWILYMGEKGDPLSQQDVLEAVSLYLVKLGLRSEGEVLTSGWLSKFFARHPEISHRKPQLVTRAAASVTESDLRKWHKNLVDWMERENLIHLKNDPNRFLNCDETNYPLNTVPNKVLVRKGQKDAYHVEKADPKKRISVMYAFNAAGQSFKPQIIVPNSLSKVPEMLDAIRGKYFYYRLFFSFLKFATP